MNPADRNLTLNIIFESTIIINEWISFEVTFARKEHSTIHDDGENLQKRLSKVFNLALQLTADIQRYCDNNRFVAGGEWRTICSKI